LALERVEEEHPMSEPAARSRCHACGTARADLTWPRICPSCALPEWRRIDVVGVMLQQNPFG
jgi:hypothetical protein